MYVTFSNFNGCVQNKMLIFIKPTLIVAENREKDESDIGSETEDFQP